MIIQAIPAKKDAYVQIRVTSRKKRALKEIASLRGETLTALIEAYIDKLVNQAAK